MRWVSTIVAFALAGSIAPAASATAPGANGKIAYALQNGIAWDVRSINPDGTDDALVVERAEHPAWSPDGTQLAYRDLTTRAIWIADATGSGGSQVSTPPPGESDSFPTWSPNGARLAFVRGPLGECSELFVIDVAGGGEQQLAPTSHCHEEALDWSPSGRLSYSAWDDGEDTQHLYLAPGDNSGAVELRDDAASPSWSPDGKQLAFGWIGSLRMWPDEPNRPTVHIWRPTTSDGGFQPDFAPDGTGFALVSGRGALFTVDDAGNLVRNLVSLSCCRVAEPDWQPLPPRPHLAGYPRPAGATPLRVSLVPAYEPCESPNREHAPPLAFGSCVPPVQSSSYLTVGTGDGGPHPARSIGSARLAVKPGDLTTATDEADVTVRVSITDVRCRGATAGCADGPSSDYTGELDMSLSVRLTDRYSGGTGDHPATVVDRFGFPRRDFPIVIPCAATADTGVGATCELSASIDAVYPGAVREGQRAIWQLGQIVLADGGGDGQAATDDNTAFAVQGVFVP